MVIGLVGPGPVCHVGCYKRKDLVPRNLVDPKMFDTVVVQVSLEQFEPILIGFVGILFQGCFGKFEVLIDAPADVIFFLIGAVRIAELLIGTESHLKKFPNGFLDEAQLFQPFLLGVDGVDGIEDLEPFIGLTTRFSKFFGD